MHCQKVALMVLLKNLSKNWLKIVVILLVSISLLIGGYFKIKFDQDLLRTETINKMVSSVQQFVDLNQPAEALAGIKTATVAGFTDPRFDSLRQQSESLLATYLEELEKSKNDKDRKIRQLLRDLEDLRSKLIVLQSDFDRMETANKRPNIIPDDGLFRDSGDPSEAFGLTQEGERFYYQGDFQSAKRRFEDALSSDKSAIKPALFLARILMKENALSESNQKRVLSLTNSIEQLQPGLLDNLEIRAQLEEAKNNYKNAILYYEKILEKDNQHQYALTGVARCHMALRDWKSLRLSSLRLCQRYPFVEIGFYYLSISGIESGDFVTGYENAKKLIEWKPSNKDYGGLYKLALKRVNKQDEYIAYLQKTSDQPDSFDECFELSEYLVGIGRDDEAKRYYQRILDDIPMKNQREVELYQDACASMTLVLMRQQKLDEAKIILETGEKLKVQGTRILSSRAKWFEYYKQNEESARYYLKAFALRKDLSDISAALNALSLYEQSADTDSILKTIDLILHVDPANFDVFKKGINTISNSSLKHSVDNLLQYTGSGIDEITLNLLVERLFKESKNAEGIIWLEKRIAMYPFQKEQLTNYIKRLKTGLQ